ncbi:hypothetical protein FRC0069_02085 [Corynebacterium diphtheriae]|nr:hypothetical protein FRC0069_02085 [Corynebacterium diphtheriae]
MRRPLPREHYLPQGASEELKATQPAGKFLLDEVNEVDEEQMSGVHVEAANLASQCLYVEWGVLDTSVLLSIKQEKSVMMP